MSVWDEKLPGGVNPTGTGIVPGGSANPLAAILQMITGGASKGAGQPPAPGGGASGPPPQMTPTATPGGMPIPGLAQMSAYQAGGPAARYQRQEPSQQLEWKTKAAANQAAIQRSVSSLTDAVVQYKQKQFEREAATTNEAVGQIIAGQAAQEKMHRGEQLSPEDLKAAATAMHMDPKVLKLIEKAQKDPMSGAYVGIQRAKQTAMAQAQAQAEAEKTAAEAYEKRQQGNYYGKAGDFQAERAQLEREKLDSREEVAKAKRESDEKVKTAQQASKNEAVAQTAPYKTGMIAVRDPDGSLKLNDKGELTMRPMTAEDVKTNPELKSHYDFQGKRIDLMSSQVTKNLVMAKVAQAKESRLAAEKAQLTTPGLIPDTARNLADPATFESTFKMLAPKTREKVLEYMNAHGMKPAKGYTPDEMKRMDLANIAYDYMSQAQEIVKKRPDLFAKGGWGRNAFKKALADQDPDAVTFVQAIKLSALPMAGIHNARAVGIVKEFEDYNSSLYTSADAAAEKIRVALDAANDMRTKAGRTQEMGGTNYGTPGAHAKPGDKTLPDDAEILKMLKALPKGGK